MLVLDLGLTQQIFHEHPDSLLCTTSI